MWLFHVHQWNDTYIILFPVYIEGYRLMSNFRDQSTIRRYIGYPVISLPSPVMCWILERCFSFIFLIDCQIMKETGEREREFRELFSFILSTSLSLLIVTHFLKYAKFYLWKFIDYSVLWPLKIFQLLSRKVRRPSVSLLSVSCLKTDFHYIMDNAKC